MNWFSRRAAFLTMVMALALGMVGTARAQVTRSLTVAVLNFSNSSGVGGALLGNKAAAAVETQLIESGRYDVVKGDLVQKTMADLNLTYPLGSVGLTQLAQALEADAVITGDVRSVTRDAKTNQVKVTLRIEMTDRTSGELTNGAIATGESGVRPDFSGAQDVLLDEALSRAAFTGVRSMNDRILPEGTIFATTSRNGQIQATLNIGTNSGVRPGMEFIVLRNREQVARLRATDVSATDSEALVVASTRGVQPEDKVRAIFRLQDIPVSSGGTSSSSAIKRPRMNIGNTILGALGLFGLYRITQGATGSGSPGARNVSAVATGPYNGAPGADSPIPANATIPAIEVSWSPPNGVARTDLLGFGIFRIAQEGYDVPVRTTDGAGRRIIDNGQAYEIGGDTGGEDLFPDGKVDGLQPGFGEVYMIRTAYRQNTDGSGGTGGDDDGGTTDDGEIRYTDEVTSSRATALLPPRAVSAVPDPSLPGNYTFTYRLVPGGDHYVIQIADNTQFTNAENFGADTQIFAPPPEISLPVNFWADDDGVRDEDGDNVAGIPDPRYPELAPIVPIPGLDLTTYYDTYAPEKTFTLNMIITRPGIPAPGGRPIFWRVGVYASGDARRPSNGGYVWGRHEVVPAPTAGAGLSSPIGAPTLVSPVGPRHPGVSGPGEGGGAGLPGGGRHDRNR